MAASSGVNGSGEPGVNRGEEIQRWTAARKAALVLDVVKGKATPADLARRHDLTVGEVESWVQTFLESGKEGLRAVPRDLEARFDAERRDLLAKVGELTLQVDALKKRRTLPRP
jgi:transposase-like protein